MGRVPDGDTPRRVLPGLLLGLDDPAVFRRRHEFVWIAGIALFVLLEKVVPFGVLGGRLAGGAMILTGLALLVSL